MEASSSMAGVEILEKDGVRVAVEGCGHGQLNPIYDSIALACKQRGWDGVDVLIICGDFQAVRNAADLTVMSVPSKYRQLGDFHEYYSGARTAPYLTIFAGGNHEASSHLWELYYGGWVAPNIYYLGAANVLRLGPIRIAGMSGIWKGPDYRKPHHERLPFSFGDKKTFYHVREIDVRKLLQLRTQVDIGVSHDWPRAIERHGDDKALFRKKPFFESESRDGTLGNPAAGYVMDRLRPPYWFSAHLHCKFSAVKTYSAPEPSLPGPGPSAPKEGTAASTTQEPPAPAENPDEIDLDLEDDEAAAPEKKSTQANTDAPGKTTSDVSEELRSQLPASFSAPQKPRIQITPGQPVPSGITNTTVRFLALDKCLPGRKFLQLVNVRPFEAPSVPTPPQDNTGPRYKLQYDPEWLAITRAFAKSLAFGDPGAYPPPDQGEESYLPLIEAEREWVEQNVVREGKLEVPENFAITASPHNPGDPESIDVQPNEYTNPQTEAYCALIEVPNLWDASEEERERRKLMTPPCTSAPVGGFRGGGYRGRGRGRGRGWRRG